MSGNKFDSWLNDLSKACNKPTNKKETSIITLAESEEDVVKKINNIKKLIGNNDNGRKLKEK